MIRIHASIAAVAVPLLFAASTTVLAWSSDIDSLGNANSLCRLEPNAQCTSAVRVGIDAPGIDMRNASMEKMRLDRANLQRGDFSSAIMQLINLEGADLLLANLEGAHLHAANLRGANLMLANMKNTNLLDADLRGANLRGANLTGAILIQARLGGATWNDGRVCAPESVGECR
ncbi:MAG TPA: pentapeptide repeat-containing protein [Sedimenticola thiotaurini]|uniref:Pentapeptide repeat-containing protein n=1 Tax=Sedimenticola thiotaurini TaxID=1543721 RepID=A0A831W667_9GAMM|nr:pentapeptide repeat-containing protein [Sedimenticola thiotaurini]